MFLGKERLFQKIKKNKEFRVLYTCMAKFTVGMATCHPTWAVCQLIFAPKFFKYHNIQITNILLMQGMLN